MNYTAEQIELFEKMFDVTIEKTCYSSVDLSESGTIEREPRGFSYNTAYARIELSNSNAYVIDYGEIDYAEELAIEAFNRFIALGYDESAFEQYLIKESSFRRER